MTFVIVFHFIELIVRHVLILATAGIMHFCSFTSEEHSARMWQKKRDAIACRVDHLPNFRKLS